MTCFPALSSFCQTLLILLALIAFPLAGASPWPLQYKIKPWETDRLTPADVVGPDGIVYPDFTGAGLTGGIPDLGDASVRGAYTLFDVTAADYGASANDGKNDDVTVARALVAALAHATKGGKSILFFPAGTFDLTAPLVIHKSHVVVQGAGKGKTILRIGPGGKAGSALLTFTPEDGRPADFTPWGGQYLAAVKNLLRGTNSATFDLDASAKGYAVGDWIRIQPTQAAAGSTMRTRFSKPENHIEYTDAAGQFGRAFIARITAIDSGTRTVSFDRSFPHDYFVDEIPQMRKGRMLEGCGVQDLTLETISADVAINPLSLTQVAESWVSEVHFLKPQNWPYQVSSVARIELRGCHFDGTWAPINSGSNAYLFIGTMDVLMQDCRANDMRHMPIFQQSMRCVVRDCVFTGKTVQSPQLHGRFPTENLVERCTFDTPDGKGQTAWATDATNTLRHGPNGPRNVFYHNVVKSGAGYIRFGGAQESPIIAYNKILRSEDSQLMPAIWASDRTFDAIIAGNVFQVSASNPAIILEDTTCTGWEVRGNHIHGSNRSLWAGDGDVSLEADNLFHSAGKAPADLKPEAASIFEWQKAHAAKSRLLIALERTMLTKTGESTRGRLVRVKADMTQDLVVDLTSDSQAISLPSRLVIPANAASVEFTITAGDAANETTVTLAAASDGLLNDTVQIIVKGADASPADFGTGKFSTTAADLPDGWRSADIGRTSAQGSVTHADGTWTVKGAGLETFLYDGTLARSGRRSVHQSLQGDGEIRARLVSSADAKQVGLMIADDEASITEYICLTADGRVLSTGHQTENSRKADEYAKAGPVTLPVWLRLSRSGSVFTAFRSTKEKPTADSDWTELTRVDFYQNNTTKEGGDYKSNSTLDAVMHFGMFVNSGSESKLATAVFDSVQVRSSATSAAEK